jgi:hypothetical protein
MMRYPKVAQYGTCEHRIAFAVTDLIAHECRRQLHNLVIFISNVLYVIFKVVENGFAGLFIGGTLEPMRKLFGLHTGFGRCLGDSTPDVRIIGHFNLRYGGSKGFHLKTV